MHSVYLRCFQLHKFVFFNGIYPIQQPVLCSRGVYEMKTVHWNVNWNGRLQINFIPTFCSYCYAMVIFLIRDMTAVCIILCYVFYMCVNVHMSRMWTVAQTCCTVRELSIKLYMFLPDFAYYLQTSYTSFYELCSCSRSRSGLVVTGKAFICCFEKAVSTSTDKVQCCKVQSG